jgi:hypothetical protein
MQLHSMQEIDDHRKLANQNSFFIAFFFFMSIDVDFECGQLMEEVE